MNQPPAVFLPSRRVVNKFIVAMDSLHRHSFTLDEVADRFYDVTGATDLNFVHQMLTHLVECGVLERHGLMHWRRPKRVH